MTFEKLLNDLTFNKITPSEVRDQISEPDKRKKINYYANIQDIAKHPLSDAQMSELIAIVGILQILENSSVGSPVTDRAYDNMQEMLVSMGIPRLTGSVEINDDLKVSHTYTTLRGTLNKIYYLSKSDQRINKNRKYLDEWIEKTEALYKERTGFDIDLNELEVLIQPKFDGVSCIMEVKNGVATWITRGDTSNNRASDVTHIMKPFTDVFKEDRDCGVKFEVMMTEENKDKINSMLIDTRYKNSRQIVTATINASEPDYKVDYLYPVPLRIIYPGEQVERIHPQLIEKFPTLRCKLKDRELIRKFGNENRYVRYRNMRLRTDGAVITILDPDIQRILGRENDINNFEIAYKFTEESGYSRVKGVEFYVSEFGRITPVLVINDIILKGNTINHITLSNKERFDELDLHYGDEVKVLYDIIPYVVIDENCRRVPYGRKIEFVQTCPACGDYLDLSQVEVQCQNPRCISKILGRVLNYCDVLRIQNIGYSTLDALWRNNFLPHGIRSLYKLRKKKDDIQMLDGFGQLKTKKIIAEIEAKRRLKDYEFFGALGIEGLSVKTFQLIFAHIPLDDFLKATQYVKLMNQLADRLVTIRGIGAAKAQLLLDYLKDPDTRKELPKLLKEVTLIPTYGSIEKPRIVFTGCRPTDEDMILIDSINATASDNWSNKAKCLIIPHDGYESSKVSKAIKLNIPIMTISEFRRRGSFQ